MDVTWILSPRNCPTFFVANQLYTCTCISFGYYACSPYLHLVYLAWTVRAISPSILYSSLTQLVTGGGDSGKDGTLAATPWLTCRWRGMDGSRKAGRIMLFITISLCMAKATDVCLAHAADAAQRRDSATAATAGGRHCNGGRCVALACLVSFSPTAWNKLPSRSQLLSHCWACLLQPQPPPASTPLSGGRRRTWTSVTLAAA